MIIAGSIVLENTLLIVLLVVIVAFVIVVLSSCLFLLNLVIPLCNPILSEIVGF